MTEQEKIDYLKRKLICLSQSLSLPLLYQTPEYKKSMDLLNQIPLMSKDNHKIDALICIVENMIDLIAD